MQQTRNASTRSSIQVSIPMTCLSMHQPSECAIFPQHRGNTLNWHHVPDPCIETTSGAFALEIPSSNSCLPIYAQFSSCDQRCFNTKIQNRWKEFNI